MLLLPLLAASAALATSIEKARPFIVSSPDRFTYARFVPTDATSGRGTGTVFRLNDDGTERVLWVVNWYSPAVEVTHAGDLISFAATPRRDSKYLAAPALLFYPRGQQTPRIYRINQLVRDFAKIECDDDGAYWRALVPPPGWSLSGFTVVTVDGVEHTFDPATGEMVSSRQLRASEFSSMGASRCAKPAQATP